MADDGKPLKVALAGLGTVGAALYYLLVSGDYKKMVLPDDLQFARPFEIVAVYAKDQTKERKVLLLGNHSLALDLVSIPFVDSANELIASNPDIVIEVTGNISFAKNLAEKTLARGIHFVTANKALMAEHGLELAKLAENNKAALRMEAAVAGGIPILHALYKKEGIKKITAILNGTTNFILDKMTNDGVNYQDALSEAQNLGFAEKADPSYDVDGHDAAAKMIIMNAIVFGQMLSENQMSVDGIIKIAPADIAAGRQKNSVYKLICTIVPGETLKVAPTLVPTDSVFGKVKGGENVVVLDFEDGRQEEFHGLGAGGIPTSESILLDLAYISGLSSNDAIIPAFRQSASAINKTELGNLRTVAHG